MDWQDCLVRLEPLALLDGLELLDPWVHLVTLDLLEHLGSVVQREHQALPVRPVPRVRPDCQEVLEQLGFQDR